MMKSRSRRARHRSPCAPSGGTAKPRLESLEERALLSGLRHAGVAGFDALTLDRAAYASDRVLVRVSPGASFTNPQLGDARALIPGLFELTLAPGVSVGQALAAARADGRILGAQPDYRVHLTAARIPNDAQFGAQWALRNTGQTGGTAGAHINAAGAWAVTTGNPNTVVAVIDTGVDYTHPDLAANMWRNPGEVPLNGRDDDRNGYVDDLYGYNFVLDNSDVYDDNGHGTHVAGTIGAVGDNGLGVAGINWNVKIMALKFLDFFGAGYLSDAVKALRYAVAHGATISNNSWGGDQNEPALAAAIEFARSRGHIFVTAAGNDGANNDRTPFYPGNYHSDNLVSVAATDKFDGLASFSNYGASTVHLAAPGVSILSTRPNNGYAMSSGTSMAVPHVTGVLALVRGLHPDWTYRQVIDQVLRTADPLPSLQGRTITGGRLNAAAAVAETVEQLGGFVQGLYRDVLGRAPDQPGLDHWVAALRDGVPRAHVADAFWKSAEHRGLQIDDYYRTFLGRDADAPGRAVWVGGFLAGMDELAVMRSFLISTEYLVKNGTTDGFVIGLYTDVLRRAPDPVGRIVWVQALEGGTPRSTVPPNFLNSAEMYRRILDEYYTKFLGRAVDAAGQQAWMSQLQTGRMTLGQVAVTILASQEYVARTRG